MSLNAENTDRYNFPVITGENYTVQTSAEKPASAYKSLKAYEKVIRKELICDVDVDVGAMIQQIWEGYEQKSNSVNRSCCNFIGKWCDRRSRKRTARVYLRTQALIVGKIAEAKVLGYVPEKQTSEITKVIAHLQGKNAQLLDGLYNSDDGIRRYGKYKGHLCNRRLDIIKTRENLINIFQRVGSQRKRNLNTWIGNNELELKTADLFFFHFHEHPERIKAALLITADEILRLKKKGNLESEEYKSQNEKFTVLIRKLTALREEEEQEEIISYCVRNCLPHCLGIIREAREAADQLPLHEQLGRVNLMQELPLITVIFAREYGQPPYPGDLFFYSDVKNMTEGHFQEMAEVLDFFLPKEEKGRILNQIWQIAFNKLNWQNNKKSFKCLNLIRFLNFYSGEDIKQPLACLGLSKEGIIVPFNTQTLLSRKRFEVLKVFIKKLDNEQRTQLRYLYCCESLKNLDFKNKKDVAHYMKIFKLFVDGEFVSNAENEELKFYNFINDEIVKKVRRGHYRNFELADRLIKHFLSIDRYDIVIELKNTLFSTWFQKYFKSVLDGENVDINKKIENFFIFLNKDNPRLNLNEVCYDNFENGLNAYQIIDKYIDSYDGWQDPAHGIKKLEELRQFLDSVDSPRASVKSAKKV